MLRVAPSDRRNFVRGRQTRAVDALRRRVTKNDQRFVYNGYLQIADTAGNVYVWDCTEPVATRPLVWQRSALGTQHSALFYTHDGNKNVSEVLATDGSLAAHYEYAPFGAVTAQTGALAATNPWRFSSEYAEDDTATVYYNYRHYEPVMGRWLQRDPAEEDGGICLYSFDNGVSQIDLLGLVTLDPRVSIATKQCSKEVKDHCKLDIAAMKSKLEEYLSNMPDKKARFSEKYRNIKAMKPRGSKIEIPEGNLMQLIRGILNDLNDVSIPIRCCPSSESGICNSDHNVSTYVRRAPQKYMDWVGSVVLCKDNLNDLQRSGGCACLVLHELMHKRGIGNVSIKTDDEAAHNAAVAANRPNENYMIYMAQALLEKLCKGYDVNDWNVLTMPNASTSK